MLSRSRIVFCLIVGCLTLSAANLTYNLSLDTSGFGGSSTEPFLEFRLSGAAGNTVTISNPDFDGGSLLSGTSTISLVSNTTTLGGNEFWQFKPGSSASFTVT